MKPYKTNLVKPFYMWAGGKTKLLKHYSLMWPEGNFSRYVEPFFGGGAVFSWLKQDDVSLDGVVGDINGELVGVLQAVSDDVEKFMQDVDVRFATYLAIPVSDKVARKEYYYDLRQEYWDSNGADSALLFVLMRLGFNGIWQTCKASKGLFGTPAGLLNHTTLGQLYSRSGLETWSKMLGNTSIQATSYENLVFDPTDALIYLDPPYRDSFTSYGTGFGDKEQVELVDWALAQCAAGATVLLANRCVEGESFFEDLLPEAEFYYFDVTYTAGRRKRVEGGHEAKPAREFLAVLKPTI